MADETTTTEEQKQTQQQEAQQAEVKETEQQQGAPDWSKAAEKYKNQRDDYQKQAEAYKKQLEELQAKGDIDAVKAELAKSHADAEAAAKQANRDRLNTCRLAQAGCVDIEVALALLDEDGDVDKLKESKPYLFGAATGSTGLKPDGASNDNGRWEKASKISGIPVEKLRK